MKQIIKTIDKSVASYITADDFAAIGAVIGHFAEVDPDSISFRYPQDKLGRNTMEGLTHINIRALAEKIGDLAARLEKFVLVAGQLNAWQCDMNATFGP